MSVLSASGYFVAGFMMCGIMSGALILWAISSGPEDDEDLADQEGH